MGFRKKKGKRWKRAMAGAGGGLGGGEGDGRRGEIYVIKNDQNLVSICMLIFKT